MLSKWNGTQRVYTLWYCYQDQENEKLIHGYINQKSGCLWIMVVVSEKKKKKSLSGSDYMGVTTVHHL